jgi:hypothetical protein
LEKGMREASRIFRVRWDARLFIRAGIGFKGIA